MKRPRLDVLTRRILAGLAEAPEPDVAKLASRAGCTPEVARSRLARLQEDGVLRGFALRLDHGKLGRPHEVFVTGSPSVRTDEDALRRLCGAKGVTRVFTLASRSSVAFTICGTDMAAVQEEARALAEGAGLEDARFTLIVNTLLDDQVHGVCDVLPPDPATT